MEKKLSDQSIDELRRSLTGTIILPVDAEYDKARRGFNALIDRRPAVIARCVGSEDIAAAFDFAWSHDLRWPCGEEDTILQVIASLMADL